MAKTQRTTQMWRVVVGFVTGAVRRNWTSRERTAVADSVVVLIAVLDVVVDVDVVVVVVVVEAVLLRLV